ncbi:hypothetical protein SCLCIDRAFT_34540 [Scleroderma citrinum Foug A]|uniref:Uncharacterized protein n=1 Tax=Scleroderma citrinum Foug A TaxID=1036808 RepID=A0A0C3D284_9AGAM|nr:hypothetical protein SCLCIDRAFT_34540 [Scleroderma citrinum Foug A]
MPWTSIAEDPQDYIKDKYLPNGVGLKEPSKLSGTQVTQILEFWRGRQQRNPKDVFMFQRWKDGEGVLQKPVGDDVSGTGMASEKQKRQDHSTMEEGNQNENGTDHSRGIPDRRREH